VQELRERQIKREKEQYSEGILRYRKEAEARPVGEQKAGMGLVSTATKAMIPVITKHVDMLESGETLPSQVPLPYHYLLGLQADAVCAIASRVCVSAAYERQKFTRTAMRIANLIEEDYRFDELMQLEPALGSSMARKAQRWPSSGARRRIMRKAAEIAGVQRFGWTEPEKVKLGVKLMEVFIEATGYGDTAMVADSGKTTKFLVMPTEVEQRIKDNHLRIEADRPMNAPMIVPPARWTSPLIGGYLTENMRMPFIRSVKTETRDDLFSADMPKVYDAVNRIQATRWAINTSVLDVLLEAHRGNGSLAGLPQMEDQPEPEKPRFVSKKWKAEHASDDEKAAFTEWKMRAREAYEFNAKLKSKRLALLTKLSLAKELRDEEAIFFPHSMDFRSRVYSMTAELSPQSDDIAKSLITFADGKPLGETGGYWLAVQIANLFGVDKVSFDERVAWTQEHSEQLVESAFNPLDGHRFWTEAEDPWCALAACFEWAGFQIEGDDFVSHLPIAMDGSCSGIQHFSAMLRDAEGGRAVNLTKTEQPSDIYTEVLNVTKDLLAKNQEPLAKVWMDKVDRKIVKRPCMTFAYSVTSIGIRDQIASEMRKATEGQYLPGHENWQAAAFLAPLVEQAIRLVVTRAAEAMDWLKALSKHFSDEEIPAMWVTPLGFPVVQPYRKHKGQVVRLWFGGERIKLSLSVEQKDVDKRKHTSSIAPNFVHSLDATHLMMVVNRLWEEGVTDSFAMIHDSFGVHACDVDAMHYVIRDEFIKLYSEDILTQTYQSTLLAMPGEKWPDVAVPPEAGDLDLEEVRDADFFFA
jgi:DNA-directed RNA polymerase